MKQLIFTGCLATLICLQCCGGKMIKDNSADAAPAPTAAAESKIPVPVATDNLVIKDLKDLNGYWVGDFEPDTSVGGVRLRNEISGDVNKINISIDTIDGEKVSGHSVVAGNFRPFKGTLEKDGSIYKFSVKEPGDDKYDGAFDFSITEGDRFLNGTWKANNSIRISARKYNLSKKLFHYDANQKIEAYRYMDIDKKKAEAYKDDDGKTYTDTAYLSTTDDIDKYNPSADLLNKDQVANFKKADIIILRNSIYARHGYSFKKWQLREYFDEQPWYIPISTDVKAQLTPIEKQNISLLLRYEKHAKEYYDTFGR
jgi:hypothetical protein